MHFREREKCLRSSFASFKRIIVKVGTRVLTSSDGKLDLNALRNISEQICDLHDSGKEIILVTSGAIGTGRTCLNLGREDMDVGMQQASAAIGQSILMEHYGEFFGKRGKCIAQVLLTQEDFKEETRFSNLLTTFERLFKLGAVPIVNENDVVATDELDTSEGQDERLFGDNDKLSSLLAAGVKADFLVMLSDVDGLLGKEGRKIDFVSGFCGLESLDNGNSKGRGGIASKLKALKHASENGIAGLIANGKSPEILERIFRGEKMGTAFEKGAKSEEVKGGLGRETALRARECGKRLAKTENEIRNIALKRMAALIEENTEEILKANGQDVLEAKESGASAAFLERLKLTLPAIKSLSHTLLKIASMPNPEKEIARWKTESGLDIRKVRVPLGAICIIFESRPDVAVEASALSIKSGNAIILKGGKEASRTNLAIAALLRQGALSSGLDEDCIQLFNGSKSDLADLLKCSDCIDLVVPRGGSSLIEFVRKNSTVPVIFAGGGVCHLYVHEDADIGMAVGIALNAKAQKPSACNSIEALLVHRKIAASLLPMLAEKLLAEGVELRCCPESIRVLKGFKTRAASEEDWGKEFSDYILAIKVVEGIEEAITRISKYGTRHSEAIITKSREAAELFAGEVDAAAIYWNASTRFTDGGQFGFGAELCISTQKLHARGPVGLDALSTYKFEIKGDGHVRK